MFTQTPTPEAVFPLSPQLVRLTDEEFLTLSNYVKDHYGINLTKKRGLIEGRLNQELRRRGFKTFSDYFKVLFADKTGNEMITLLNRLTTNLSYFMRENEHFNFLMKQALPAFEKTHATHELRIWSAGCSTGQEAYNTAMVINEYFGARKSLWKVKILATDLSRQVLAKAEKGVYTPEELKDLPAAWRTKYLIPAEGGNFQIAPALRAEVEFKPGNLMEPFQFPRPFDLIFCRNVMIYFDGPTKAKLVKKFYDCTADGGYLFIGHSESILGTGTQYGYIQPAIYQRKG